MDAGVNLMVEKPLAGSAAELDLLLDQAASCHVQICPVHQFVYQDGAVQTSGWLPSLGRPASRAERFLFGGRRRNRWRQVWMKLPVRF